MYRNSMHHKLWKSIFRITASVILMVTAFFSFHGSAQAAEFSFTCPAGDTVKETKIPSSHSCSYSAESDGVQFGGLRTCGLAGLPFIGAQVSEVNDYWSITCGYSAGFLQNSLSVGPAPSIEKCRFQNQTQTCEGNIKDCKITCPQKPVSQL